MLKKHIKADQFVATWMAAHREGYNSGWVAEQLGMTRSAALGRALRMRKRGVNIPELRGHGSRIETNRLNKLIKKIENDEHVQQG